MALGGGGGHGSNQGATKAVNPSMAPNLNW